MLSRSSPFTCLSSRRSDVSYTHATAMQCNTILLPFLHHPFSLSLSLTSYSTLRSFPLPLSSRASSHHHLHPFFYLFIMSLFHSIYVCFSFFIMIMTQTSVTTSGENNDPTAKKRFTRLLLFFLLIHS